MKKLLSILLLIFAFTTIKAQFPNTTFRANPKTLDSVASATRVALGFINNVWADTTAANTNTYLKYYNGATIYTSTGGLKTWGRYNNTWVLQSGGGSGGNSWNLGGNTIANPTLEPFGSINSQDVNFITNNLKRFSLNASGILPVAGTAKPIGIDSVTGYLTYINPSSGSANTSVGSGFKYAINGTNNIKSGTAGIWLVIDSATSNQVNYKADSAAIVARMKQVAQDTVYGNAAYFRNAMTGDTIFTNPSANHFLFKSHIPGEWMLPSNVTDTSFGETIDTASLFPAIRATISVGGNQTPWLSDINANNYGVDSITHSLFGAYTGTAGTNTYATLNPSDKSGNVTLSGGNLTGTMTGGANGQARTTISMDNTQKVYWECYPSTVIDVTAFGISVLASSNAQIPGQISPDVGYWSSGFGSGGSPTGTQASWTNGDVISFSWDGPAGTLTAKKNNTSQVVWTGLSGTYYATFGAQDQGGGQAATMNFGASAFTYSVPSGFRAGIYTSSGSGVVYNEVLRTDSQNIYLPSLVLHPVDTTNYKITVKATSDDKLAEMNWPTAAQLGGLTSISIGQSITSATDGSVLFAGTGGKLMQKNSDFFYDSTNKRLGIGTNSPTVSLHVVGDMRTTGSLYMPTSSGGVGGLWINNVRFLHNEGSGNFNGFFGFGAGFANTGSSNTGIGKGAQASMAGNFNSTLGYENLFNATTGNNNVAIGKQAMVSADGVNDHVAIGTSALAGVTSGASNIGIGKIALSTLTGGTGNVAVCASCTVTSGGFNTFIGSDNHINGGSINNETSIGGQTMRNHKSGGENTAVGAQALNADTTGANNTVIGSSALYLNQGSSNVALGYLSGASETAVSNSLMINNSTSTTYLIGGLFSSSKIGINKTLSAINSGEATLQVGGSESIDDSLTIGKTRTVSNATSAYVKDPITNKVALQTISTVATAVPLSGITSGLANNSINNGGFNFSVNNTGANGIVLNGGNSSSAPFSQLDLNITSSSLLSQTAGGVNSILVTTRNGSGLTGVNKKSAAYMAVAGNWFIALDSNHAKIKTDTVSIINGALNFNGTTSGTVILKAPATAGTPTLTLPTVTGTVMQKSESAITSSSTPAPAGDAVVNYFDITALATNATISAPSGTPANHNSLLIRIKDNGTSRTLTWDAIFRGTTALPLPSATVISETMYTQFFYNSADSKWDFVGYTPGFVP